MADKKYTFAGKEYTALTVPSELTFPLRKPVTIAGLTIESLEMQEPTVDECEKYSKALNDTNAIGATAKLIAMIAAKGNGEVSEPFIKALSIRDFNDINAYLDFFISPGQ